MSALLPQCLGQFGNEIGGHGRQPISLGPCAKTKIESGLVILLGRDTLFRNEPSAMMASSGERRPARSDLDKTQCGTSGLRAAFLYWDQFLQPCLWLQSWSSTEACLTKTVLNDGVWHGT